MPSSCEFQLNKLNAVYFSGETIEGTIVLNTTSPKDIRDVRIIFKGEGKVNWQETESRRNADGTTSRRTIYFKSYELYVDNSSYVRGEGTLPPGTYTYTFLIPLPMECPTSVEGRYGHIRYELTLQLNRPFRFDNVYNKPITVLKSCDLNLIPAYKLPVECEEITTSCCWSCSGGKIISTLRAPFCGYTPGQAVKFSLHIQNQAMSDIDGYSIEFRKQILFTANTPHNKTREEKSTLYTKRYDETCLRLTTCLFEKHFLIPATPPSTNHRGIITVEYYLKATVHLDSCEMDSVLKIPIFVGTIPLRESLVPTEATENSHLIQMMQPTAPDFSFSDNVTGNDLPPNYKDLGPPTFEEAMRSSSPFIDTDKDERHRNTGFRPLYPMYSQIARIDFRGEAKILSEKRNSSDRQVLATEVYINNGTYVRDEGYLPAGIHSYTFSIPLPLPSPTSIEAKNGYLRYTLSLVLARPLRKDTIFTKRISVVQNVDLNLNTSNKFPVITEHLNYLGCYPFTSGKIHYSLQVPFAAYAPGQNVKYSIFIKNQSMVDLNGYTLKFKQKYKFYIKSFGYGNRQYKNTLLSKSVQKNCLRLTTRLWEGEFLIPPMPPTTINQQIITVNYVLKIKIHLSSFTNRDCTLYAPIIIGTIPVRESLVIAQRPLECLDGHSAVEGVV